MNFAGKWGVMEMMVADYEERQEKLQAIVAHIRRSPETNVDISGVCRDLNIRLTGEEMEWIVSQIY